MDDDKRVDRGRDDLLVRVYCTAFLFLLHTSTSTSTPTSTSTSTSTFTSTSTSTSTSTTFPSTSTYLSSFADRFLVGVKESIFTPQGGLGGIQTETAECSQLVNSVRNDQNSRRTSSGTISFGACKCILASQGRGFGSWSIDIP